MTTPPSHEDDKFNPFKPVDPVTAPFYDTADFYEWYKKHQERMRLEGKLRSELRPFRVLLDRPQVHDYDWPAAPYTPPIVHKHDEELLEKIADWRFKRW